MKKPIIIALLLLLAALCACSAPASKTGALQTEEKPQDDPVKPSASAAPPALQAKYMNEPPALKVSCGDKEITVGPSSYEWTVVLPDGTARTTAA
ncbi:MAG: hypothetical protein J5760_00945, partial [Clostridia bacterium]|nr:hypothetical protein [Clostridia bacterium]